MACPFAYICILYSAKKRVCTKEPESCSIIEQHHAKYLKPDKQKPNCETCTKVTRKHGIVSAVCVQCQREQIPKTVTPDEQ